MTYFDISLNPASVLRYHLDYLQVRKGTQMDKIGKLSEIFSKKCCFAIIKYILKLFTP